MRIGIDITQIVYEGTGVARYVQEMVKHLIQADTTNHYVLFGSSLRLRHKFVEFCQTLSVDKTRVSFRFYPFPPRVLDTVWNIFHVVPIEWLIGDVDVFWSSDWTQPPLQKARGVTTIHDLTIYRFPESFDQHIVSVHKRKIQRSVHECHTFFCDSEATKKDAIQFLHIPEEQLHVVYPGYMLSL